MTALFTYAEGSILLRLLIAHLLTDFFFQPDKWVEEKKKKTWRSKYLLLHVIVAGLLAYIFMWKISLWWAGAITAATHYVVDAIKLGLSAKVETSKTTTETKAKKSLLYFLMDQAAHIAVILALWIWIINGVDTVKLAEVFSSYRLLLVLAGYMVVLSPAGYCVGFFTRRWSDEIDLKDSLKDVGKWIGMMERLIILTLVLLTQFAAIGFLITAKSLLRLIDKPDTTKLVDQSLPFSSRKHTEYVLIGTFLSFSIALIVGILINYLLKF